jgi:phosphoglycerate dehydrogenase-like enzyme
VDEKALVEALRKGLIREASHDVLENEPELSPALAEAVRNLCSPGAK